ncbi:MAG TPA: DUF1853 family protein, partial [Arcobacter sp.]|nr:DUF1853 family protein [Arcobacter sp.]
MNIINLLIKMENNLREQFLGFYQTPFLFNNTITQLQLFEFDLINIDQINFSKLKIKQKLPLGKRVEQFFQFYLSHSKRYNIIKQNIQIIHNKNTIGEIDFILYDKLKMKTIHLELVYKFYLYDSTFNDGFHGYIGPNRDDTLVKKITKLKK